MREILFRAKRKDNGEWVNGSPFPPANACKMINAVALHPDFVEDEGPDGHVYYSEGWPVDTATVGQYTGLKDKTGRRIFEGDIVRVPSFEQPVMQIAFIEGAFCLADAAGEYAADIHYIHHAGDNQTEIIGNIYDNPELMGGEKR